MTDCPYCAPDEPCALHLGHLPVLAMVRVCPDCCPACRAAAAEALGEPVDRCGFCGHAVLPELGPCPCIEQAVAADRNKIERRAKETGRPAAEIEAEFLAIYEGRQP